jgi:hypothetical protein
MAGDAMLARDVIGDIEKALALRSASARLKENERSTQKGGERKHTKPEISSVGRSAG